eukprot:9903373-Ditylum_brightwellii.AAC.1
MLEALTCLTSSKNKFIWDPEQATDLKAIKQTMAQKILLHFPNLSKTFDIYTDASDCQLSSVMCQDNWPIAFYSRKLNPAH